MNSRAHQFISLRSPRWPRCRSPTSPPTEPHPRPTLFAAAVALIACESGALHISNWSPAAQTRLSGRRLRRQRFPKRWRRPRSARPGDQISYRHSSLYGSLDNIRHRTRIPRADGRRLRQGPCSAQISLNEVRIRTVRDAGYGGLVELCGRDGMLWRNVPRPPSCRRLRRLQQLGLSNRQEMPPRDLRRTSIGVSVSRRAGRRHL